MSVRRGFVLTLKFALAFGLLAWLVLSGRLDFRILNNAEANWYWLVAAFFLYGGIQLMTAIRWRWLLAVVGQSCTIGKSFWITLASLLFNQVLIGSTGGDIYRVMVFDVDDARQRIAIAVSVAMDRVIGLYALAVLIPVAAMWNVELIGKNDVLALVALGGLAAVLGLPVISWAIFRRGLVSSPNQSESVHQPRILRWLEYAKDGLALYSGHWPLVGRAVVFSLMIQALIVAVNVLIAFSILGTGIDWPAMFLLIPAALLVMAVPLNPPGAIGTGEAVYSVLLELAGVAQGSIISLFQRLINILWALPSLLFIVDPRDVRGASEGTNEREARGVGNLK